MLPLRDLNPSRSTPWVTWGTMLLCVLVFVFEVVQPDPTDAYALVPARITAMFENGVDVAALATVFTSMFMHGGLLHIAGNLWFLRIFGDNVEDNFGSLRFALFYVLCGIGAAIGQIVIDPYSTVRMVGASGAIAGVLAAYLVLYPHARVVTLVPLLVFYTIVEWPAYIVIAVWFGLQFFSGVASLGIHSGGGVAYWAHIGGFATGLVLALVFRRRPEVPQSRDRQSRWRADSDWR